MSRKNCLLAGRHLGADRSSSLAKKKDTQEAEIGKGRQRERRKRHRKRDRKKDREINREIDTVIIKAVEILSL